MSRTQTKGLLSMRCAFALSFLALSSGVALSVGDALPSTAASPDGDPVLKMDTPKLDMLPEKQTLKGGVSHHETKIAPRPAKLQSSSATASIKAQDSKLKTGTTKRGGFLNMFKNKAKLAKEKPPTTLNAQAQSGVGIIGVKFIIGYQLSPTINRVFPGTPAANAGLREHDIIVAVDGVPTAGLTKEEVYAMIVGLPETPVTISILRDGDFAAKSMVRMDFNDIPDPAVKEDYLMSI